MGARAHELANTGEVIKAQRIQARVTYIAGLHFGPTDSEMLTVRGNAAAISALARDWESVVTDAEFVVFHMTKQAAQTVRKGSKCGICLWLDL
jgi:predicted mannosyl-3-phosphoglycerate phosphatase (HAD superfamily)